MTDNEQPTSDRLDDSTDLSAVVNGILAGRIVPFLGAGANRCGDNSVWDPAKKNRLPSGTELSHYLAHKFKYPIKPPAAPAYENILNLARVAQYADTIEGRGPLDDELRPLFQGPFGVTAVHNFLAQLSNRTRPQIEKHPDYEFRKHLIIVTTNYDNVMERAFDHAKQRFHLITYVSNSNIPLFRHYTPGGEEIEITIGNANNYHGLDEDDLPVLLKIHGDRHGDNFVITEDDYLNYLSFGDIASALPKSLYAQLIKSGFLFLGYALQDWNLRAFMLRIWREQRHQQYNSWAVMVRSSRFEQRYWRSNNVEIVHSDLAAFIPQLDQVLTEALA